MESDQYMPEYWPANRIIGKLEKALVKAENILGLIQSEQIAALAAGKVTGLLTNAQLESIEAAKLTGLITGVQVKEETLEARHVKAATLTGNQIAAGSITAEKLSVIKLSAIASDIGTIKAGTIEGVDLILPLDHFAEAESKYSVESAIDWKKESTSRVKIWATDGGTAGKKNFLYLEANRSEKASEGGRVLMMAFRPAKEPTYIQVISEAAGEQIIAKAGAAAARTILNSSAESDFLQLPATAKTRIVVGLVSAAGVKEAGNEAFTVTHPGAGEYKIKLATAMASNPVVSANDAQGTQRTASVGVLGKQEFNVILSNGTGAKENIAFSFTAVG